VAVLRIHLRVDRELYSTIHHLAKEQQLPVSEIVRTLLRSSLGIARTTFDAGYREGREAGYAEARKEFELKFRAMPATGEKPKKRG